MRRPALLLLCLLGCKEKPSPTPTPTPSPTPTPTPNRTPTPTPIPIPTPTVIQAATNLAGARKLDCAALDENDDPTRPKATPVLPGLRPGTRAASAKFGAHEVFVYLADQKTSEGVVLHAFASIDGGRPVRVSEDGAGATSVDVAQRGQTAIVAYLDARSAMTPVHARVLREVNGKVELGKDAVIFLGGAPDPNVAGALGTTPDQAFYVLPIAKDATTFGMAIIRIDDPPREEEPVTWAMYPSGLDPAPIAVTRDVAPIRVARVVPKEPSPNAARVIELGEIEPSGAFRSLGIAAERPRCSFLRARAEGPKLVLAFGDSEGYELMKCAR